MKGVGEPCAGEPHARFDGRGLETERYGVTAPAPDPTILTVQSGVQKVQSQSSTKGHIDINRDSKYIPAK